MISDPQILVFPYFLDTKPEVFSMEDLQDLDQTLADLQSNPPKNVDKIIRNWFKARLTIRDEFRKFEKQRKELGKVPPTPPIQPDRLNNWFQELREQVKDQLNSKGNGEQGKGNRK
ncbi:MULTISPECIES: hypothetical protein [Moorena]|uniref:Uncharacterized protein n=1 Tax=Moorena producens 3L TaxID=489825 RepID=F4XVJ7_9CYAN|nr:MULTISPECIES: hypothetical protein [Moorena]EGJ31260.1 hypothetical protein LYNGBM3L_40430 [Moorena producens 3L]NEP70174.1 hypothetical protein [Moorena sp. SIO3A5]NER92143.1 hypothetical protein [Moorena sp. SIO3A2]OLT66321.1 hypothetical protein BI334_16015 [Moorena producens 3L]